MQLQYSLPSQQRLRKDDDAQRALFTTFHVVKHLCDFEGVPREKLGQHCECAEFVMYVHIYVHTLVLMVSANSNQHYKL